MSETLLFTKEGRNYVCGEYVIRPPIVRGRDTWGVWVNDVPEGRCDTLREAMQWVKQHKLHAMRGAAEE